MKIKNKTDKRRIPANLAKPGTKPKYNGSHNMKRKSEGLEIKGAKSLVQKLEEANLLTAVCVVTRNYRIAHPVSSYMDLYRELNKQFPDFFPIKEKMWGGSNFSKLLHSCPEWSACYWAGAYNFDDVLETKIYSKLYNDELDNKDLVKVYDVRQKYKQNKEIMDTIEKNVNVEIKY